MSKGRVTAVFGGQVGSEGKGAIAGFLALREGFSASIHNFMPNAGHTWVSDYGNKIVVKQLPIALVDRRPALLIGPGAAISLPVLLEEIERYDPGYNVKSRLMIDGRAVIVEDRHKEDGKEFSVARAGVGAGCSRANAEKSMRLPTTVLARDIPELKSYIGDVVGFVNSIIDKGGDVLAEGAQGFDLDINHGYEYPFCTSRGTTPMQLMADCGLAPNLLHRSIAVVRSYPIRVGNINETCKDCGGGYVFNRTERMGKVCASCDGAGKIHGYSGGFGGKELSWDEIRRRSGMPEDMFLEERTTVTNRVRRVFEVDWERLDRMSRVCRPTEIALTFADYIDWSAFGHRSTDCLSGKIYDFVDNLEKYTGAPVTMLKTGPADSHMVYDAGGI